MSITVMVADNNHYMDEGSKYELGSFSSIEDAVIASKSIVDDYLKSAYRAGMTAQELFESYTRFGEDPYIVATEVGGVPFSAWDYARERCAALCEPAADTTPISGVK